MKSVSLLGALLVLGGCSCGGDEDAETVGAPAESSASASETASETGVIEGVVRLAEGAELPAYPRNPLVAPNGRPTIPEACTPPQRRDETPVRQGAEGLDGVLVALHDFSTSPRHEPQTREVTIRDCRLEPRLLVATRGDRLRIVNETDYPFFPDFGMGMLQAVLHEGSQDYELTQGGVRTLECGFSAPCGRTEIVTLYHSLHAVTDDEGRFRIEGVPPDEEVRVSAWHPLFREASETVRVAAGESRRVELVLAPAPSEPPAGEETEETEEAGPAEDDPSQLF